jgi:hypothetical protein
MKNQEVRNEEAAVEMIRATDDQTRDCAVPPRHTGSSHKGLMTEKRQRKGPECNNGIKDRGTATSVEGEDIQQDLQEGHRAGDRKTKSRVFDWDTGSEWTRHHGGVTPSETKEETSKAQPL